MSHLTLPRLTAVLLAALLLAACAPPEDAFAPAGPTPAAVVAEADSSLPANRLTPDVFPPEDGSLGYLLQLPPGYDPAELYPLFIMLHGSGLENVPLATLAEMPVLPPVFSQPDGAYPFIVLMPQMPVDQTWVESLDALESTLDRVEGDYSVDPDRIYLTGFSMGGAGALAWGMQSPERFAALVSVAGYWPYNEDPTLSNRACALAGLPTRLYQSAIDSTVTLDAFQLVRLGLVRCGIQPEVTLYESVTHQDTFTAAYSNQALYEWLSDQARGAAEASSGALISVPRPAPDLYPVETDDSLSPTSVGYLVSLPADYDPARAERYPVLVLLHGSGSGGFDIGAYARSDSLLTLLQREPGLQPFIVVAPQALPGVGWTAQTALLDDMLDAVTAAYPVDTARISVAGFSMGAIGAWGWATEQPDRFAALVPMGGRWPYEMSPGADERLCRIAHIPTWVFHSQADETVPYRASEEVVAAYDGCQGTADVRFTTYETQSHLGTPVEALRSAELYDWLLGQVNPAPAVVERDPDSGLASRAPDAVVDVAFGDDLSPVRLAYLVYLPPGYDESAGPYPVIVRLHGPDGSFAPLDVFADNFSDPAILSERGDAFPFILVIPKSLPGGRWEDQVSLLDAVLDAVLADYAADPDRVSLLGFSVGGAGVYAWAMEHPERFAALMTVAGIWPGYDWPLPAQPLGRPGLDERNCTLADLPVWVVIGDADTQIPPAFSQEIGAALADCGADVQEVIYPGLEHFDAAARAYEDADLYAWLLEQSR